MIANFIPKGRWVGLIAGVLISEMAMGQYVVESPSLGALTQSSPLTVMGASTATAPTNNAAELYFDFNEGLYWSNERVYQFEITEPLLIFLDVANVTGDPDFFILSSLDIEVNPFTLQTQSTGVEEVLFLDTVDSGNFGAYMPGTYYLVMESYTGSALNTASNVSADLTLSALPAAAIDFAGSLGVSSGSEQPIGFTTEGTGFDAVLAVYDFNGALLFTDSVGSGESFAEINIPDGLAVGDYFVGVGGPGTVFAANFLTTTGPSSGGAAVVNVPSGFLPPLVDIPTTLDTSNVATATKFWFFEVVTSAEPTSFLTLNEIAEEGAPLTFDLSASDFDTVVGIFDSSGLLVAHNDDIDGANSVFESSIDLPDGLAAGDYFLGISGWPSLYYNGWVIDPTLAFGGDTDSGVFSMTHTLGGATGSQGGSIASGGSQWFSFSIGGLAPPPSLEITDFVYDAATEMVTLTWTDSGSLVYQVTSSETLEGTTGVPLFSDVVAPGIIGTTATFAVDVNAIPKLFFRVEEVPSS